MGAVSNRKPCVIVGWDIWKNLTGKEGKHYFFKRKYIDKNGINTWKGDEFFSGNKELAEFFGIGEDLKELDGVKLGQVFRILALYNAAGRRLSFEVSFRRRGVPNNRALNYCVKWLTSSSSV